jgi:hypothetical protein
MTFLALKEDTLLMKVEILEANGAQLGGPRAGVI